MLYCGKSLCNNLFNISFRLTGTYSLNFKHEGSQFEPRPPPHSSMYYFYVLPVTFPVHTRYVLTFIFF